MLQFAVTHINCTSNIVVLMCENIFSERIIRVWNSLPPSNVSFESLLSVRNSLGNVNLVIHTKYRYVVFVVSFVVSFFIVVVFSFKVTSNFVCITFICISLLTMWHVSE